MLVGIAVQEDPLAAFTKPPEGKSSRVTFGDDPMLGLVCNTGRAMTLCIAAQTHVLNLPHDQLPVLQEDPLAACTKPLEEKPSWAIFGDDPMLGLLACKTAQTITLCITAETHILESPHNLLPVLQEDPLAAFTKPPEEKSSWTTFGNDPYSQGFSAQPEAEDYFGVGDDPLAAYNHRDEGLPLLSAGLGAVLPAIGTELCPVMLIDVPNQGYSAHLEGEHYFEVGGDPLAACHQ